jgi:hypothetical protein
MRILKGFHNCLEVTVCPEAFHVFFVQGSRVILMLCSDESSQDSHHALQSTPCVPKHKESKCTISQTMAKLVYFDLEKT